MFGVVLFVLTLLVPQPAKPVALPDTPQGKHLQAYINGFNTGDEQKYLAMMNVHMEPGLLKRRSAEERAKLFQRLRATSGRSKCRKC